MSENLDKSTIRVLKNAFGAFDPLNTGSIKSKDVGTILEMLGHKMDDKSVAKIVAEADKDNSGELDFDEFCAFAAKYVEVEEDLSAAARDLKEAFRLYDREGNGYLTVQVLRQILHELDDKLTNEELDMMIDEIDADGSGTVDFDEFMNVMIGD